MGGSAKITYTCAMSVASFHVENLWNILVQSPATPKPTTAGITSINPDLPASRTLECSV